MKNLLSLLLMVLMSMVIVSISGCISSYPKPKSAEYRAKRFKAKEDAAIVYVFRSEGLASSVKIPIWLDGTPVAQTSARSFLVLELEPGVHTLISKTSPESSLSLAVTLGEVYFIWQDINIGLLSPRSELIQVNAERGMDQVRNSALIEGYL